MNGEVFPLTWAAGSANPKWKMVRNWFSNMTNVEGGIIWNGIVFPSVEHAYVANKFKDPAKWRQIASMPHPGQVKRYGRETPLEVENWDVVKGPILYELCCQKWQKEPWRSLLLEYKGTLVEFNNWNDTYYGVSIDNYGAIKPKGGFNNLGKILMQIQDCLRRGVDPLAEKFTPNMASVVVTSGLPADPQPTLF